MTAAQAPVADPRRAIGDLLGHGVRFGPVQDVLIAGARGSRPMLSLQSLLAPSLPVAAALSAAHLAAMLFPRPLRRLYIAADNDAAGRWASHRLAERALEAQIEPRLLNARLDDWNADLRAFGPAQLLAVVARQLAPDDLACFALCGAAIAPTS